MELTRAKLDYLVRVVGHRLRLQPRICPYCREARDLRLLGRKQLIIEIFRCERCGLIFRYPLETTRDNAERYQTIYDQAEVTVLPTEKELARFAADEFQGGSDCGPKVSALAALVPSGRVLDFGCSWGYGVHQLRSAGFDATGFEISRPRARFGREKLGVPIIDDPAELAGLPAHSFDAIFSSHVIEHLPDLAAAFDLFSRLLIPSGLLFATIPNFSGSAARAGLFWHWIGQDHPIAPTHEFLARALLEHGFASVRFGSGPFDERMVERLAARDFDALDTEGEELLIIGRTSASR
ncbi:MAG: class I SAM-dependent methyltransferase [Candidatus Binatus sp.]|uniref:class I SAM-dependent methyltransferase n=1 Tax=Candidatus Binatus sp. TaxID=2811406 RepID=UPI003C780D75